MINSLIDGVVGRKAGVCVLWPLDDKRFVRDSFMSFLARFANMELVTAVPFGHCFRQAVEIRDTYTILSIVQVVFPLYKYLPYK